MGSTNSTTYYQLSQFIATDKPAWLQDYNGDMLKIDTAINGAKVAADAAQLAADAAQGDATTALGSIAIMSDDISAIQLALGTAVGNINTINSLIGNGTPTTTDQTIIGAINEINDTVSELPNQYVVVDTNQTVTVTSDGTKTVAELCKDLADAIITYAQSMPAGYIAKIYRLDGAVVGRSEGVTKEIIFSSNASSLEAEFITAYYDTNASAIRLRTTTISTTEANNSIHGVLLDSNLTVTDYGPTTPANNRDLIAHFEIYKKL